MKKLLFALAIVLPQFGICQWTDMNTGINDYLTGVVFWGNNGMLSGHKGLYYTTTGGNGAAAWNRFSITGNTADSLVYARTRFNHCFSHYLGVGANKVFACGEDTVSRRAVLMYISLPSFSYKLFSLPVVNGALNRVDYSVYEGTYYAVGDSGLLISFSETGFTVIPTVFTENFTSISTYNNRFWIGAPDVALTGTFHDTTFAFTVAHTPGITHRDVFYYNQSYAYSVGEDYYYRYSNSVVSTMRGFDFGPLSGRSMIYRSYYVFVGTDHGIFRSTPNFSVLEWQPSSQQHTINCFWGESAATDFFACGPAGLLLKTTDNGGAIKPYITMSPVSASCEGMVSYLQVQNEGSSTGCEFFANGQEIYSGACNVVVSHVFDSAGTYQIDLYGYANGNEDTATTIIYIADTPQLDLPVVLADTILCKAEPLNITIPQAEQNIFYTLRKFGSATNYGSSGTGAAGPLLFTSNTLTEGGYYHLRAQAASTNCAVNFTDSIHVVVEKTHADLHSGTINAATGEAVDFFAACTEAQNYAWTFSAGAASTGSFLSEPQNSFSAPGQTQVTLEAWSNNGCYDTIVQPGPFIYTPSATQDSCWTLINRSVDPQWSGHYYSDISEMKPAHDGFFTCGYFNDEIFDSKLGTTYTPPLTIGGYLAKHDRHGVLKWMVYTRYNSNMGRDNIYSVVEDSAGNIYLCGNTVDYFYDNAGDSVDLNLTPATGLHSAYIVKLDSKGRLVWYLQGDRFAPNKLFLDKEHNLIAAGQISSSSNVKIVLNGVVTDTINRFNSTPSKDYVIVKINPAGRVIWDAGMYIYDTNGSDIRDITYDDQNNLYVTGVYEHYVHFYSAGSAVPDTLVGYPGTYGQRFFLAKYNSAGILQWRMRNGVGAGNRRNVEVTSMVTDDSGNCYITGGSDCIVAAQSMAFENTDGTTTKESVGRFFIAKVNGAGVCEWIRGGRYSYYGAGLQIIRNGDELSVIGEVGNNTSAPEEIEFTSANRMTDTITFHPSDFFIVLYDTAGNLLRTYRNGVNIQNVVSSYGYNGLFKAGDAYYFSNNIHFSNGVQYANFGDTLSSAFNREGTVTRFVEDCAIVYRPGTTCDTVHPALVNLYETRCDRYIGPSGRIYDSTGVYIDSLFSPWGCDTFFTIHLTIIAGVPDTISVTTCKSYTSPGGNVFNNTGTYSDTVFTSSGCDTFFTIHLTIINSTADTIEATACNYISPAGNIYQHTGIYTDTISSAAGCDSIVTIHLTVPNDTLVVLSETACELYTSPSGKIWTNTGVYHDTLADSYGCDSVLQIHLVVAHLDNTIATINDTALRSNMTGAVYFQWVDCNNDLTPIGGETDNLFIPAHSGSYAVIVSQFNCADTSGCTPVIINSVMHSTFDAKLILSPNPTENLYTIALGKTYSSLILQQHNLGGKLFHTEAFKNISSLRVELKGAPGMYIVSLFAEGKEARVKVMKE